MSRLGELATIDPPVEPAARPPRRLGLIAIADVDVASATATPRTRAAGDKLGGALRQAAAGDVIFARISPSMENGKVAIVPDLGDAEIYVSREFFILRPNPEVDPRLIWAALRRRAVRERLRHSLQGSSGRLRVDKEALLAVEVADVPAAEWDRAIEALEHVDRARSLRAEIVDLLAGFPAAVAERAAAGFELEPLESFGGRIEFSSSSPSKSSGGLPLVRAADLGPAGAIGRGDLGLVNPLEVAGYDRLAVGDVLIAALSSSRRAPGRAAVYEGEPQAATYASDLIRVRGQQLRPDVLWVWLQTEASRSFLTAEATPGSARTNLSRRILQRLPVPRLGAEAQDWLTEVVRNARAQWRTMTEQLGLLDALVQSHLDRVLGAGAGGRGVEALASAAVAFGTSVQAAPAEIPLPRLFENASARQRRVWTAALERTGVFSLAELEAEPKQRAETQHSLLLLENLGLLIREDDGPGYRWRVPDPDVERLA